MEGSPKKGRLWLPAILVMILLSSVLATKIVGKREVGDEITDTAIRSELLRKKVETADLAGFLPQESFLYSSIIYDHQVNAGTSLTLPWAANAITLPSGDYRFSWRVKLLDRAAFSIEDKDSTTNAHYSIMVSARDGSPRYFKSNELALPYQVVELTPGIYLIEASSLKSLDNFKLHFKSVTKTDTSVQNVKATYPERLTTIKLSLNARAKKNLDRMVTLAKESSKTDIIKMPGARVDGEILFENGGSPVEVRVGLSGRSKEHLIGNPSLDIKVKGNKSILGTASFKLYKLSTKVGLLDFIHLSILKDFGYFVPRQDIVLLEINGEQLGAFLLMETPSQTLHINQKRLEGNIIGVNLDKMFFDYPYGANLELKRFYKSKDSLVDKTTSESFISSDFLPRMEKDRVAAYLAYTATYMASHGLGVDDLRFNFDPASGLFSLIPRDLSPGFNMKNIVQLFKTSMGWSTNSPLYSVWPTSTLYNFDNTPVNPLDSTNQVTSMSTYIRFTDIHFAIINFLSKPKNLEATNRYFDYFMNNDALKKKITARLINASKIVLDEDPEAEYVRFFMDEASRKGVRSLGKLPGRAREDHNPVFIGEYANYQWNLRTSRTLMDSLIPSFIAPLRVNISMEQYRNQLALNFLVEKNIFDMLEKAGLRIPKKSFEELDKNSIIKADAIELLPLEYSTINKSTKNAEATHYNNVATYLSTLFTSDDNAIVLFLVRNATDDVSDYKINFRDSMTMLEPTVNSLFILNNNTQTKRHSLIEIMKNHFSPGERLRLLAFKIELGNKPIFYSLNAPAGSKYLMPPMIYLPTRSGTSPIIEKAKSVIKNGIIELDDGFHIPAHTSLKVDSDIVIPAGRDLYIEEGVQLELAPGTTIKVTGNLSILGTSSWPVRFSDGGNGAWGGLYAAGEPSNPIKVILQNVVFDKFGTFPKTRIGELFVNGGLTFYHANVDIEGVQIKGSMAEDALNLISCRANIKDLSVSGSNSDSVDLDFSFALINSLAIKDSGGDALDLSFSLVKLVGSSLVDNADKGLSIGEKSWVYVEDTLIKGNAMGIANKDQSFVDVKDSIFEANDIAIAEFIKKPSFAKPSSKISNSTYRANMEDYKWLGFYSY